MYAKTIGGLSRRNALAAVALVAAVALIAALYLAQAVRRTAADADAAFARLQNDKASADKYRQASGASVKLSADVIEARSNDFLLQTLSRNSLPATNVQYSNPAARAGGLEMMEIDIECDGVQLASVVNFLRQVETGRRNLALLEANLDKADPARDAWSVHLKYAAFIQAKSRT